MRHLLIILSLFLFSFTVISCGYEKEESAENSGTNTTNSSGVFMAVGTGIILKSTDGTTWSSVSTTASDNDNSSTDGGFKSTQLLNDISYGSSTYVMVGSNYSGSAGSIYTSLDGTTWTLRSSGTTNTLNGLTYKE